MIDNVPDGYKVCPMCGAVFKSNSSIHTYCSIKCRNRRQNEIAQRDYKKAVKYEPKIHYFGGIGMPEMDQMSGDELLHYGKVSARVQQEKK